MRSVEADIALRQDVDGSKADLIDGSIGEASLFQETFGFYAHGVSVTTALLPRGWEQRLVRFVTPATGGVVAWCLSRRTCGLPKLWRPGRRTSSCVGGSSIRESYSGTRWPS